MRLYKITAVALCIAVVTGDFRQNPTLEDLRKLMPAMIQGLDRIQNIDPLHVLRTLQGGNDKFNLTLPNSVQSWHLEAIEQLIDEDSNGIIHHLVGLLDKEKRVDERSLPTFILRYLVAPITPVLNVNGTCFRQSLAYMKHLLQLDSIWAWQMLDSTGKIPDGVLSDMTDLCSIYDYWIQPNYCQENDFSVEIVPGVVNLTNLFIPRGNTIAFGSFDGCLKATAVRNDSAVPPDLLQWEDFVGQHCLVQLAVVEDATDPIVDPETKMALLPGWVAGLVPQGPLTTALSSLYISRVNARWGQCVPSGCTEEDVYQNYRELYAGLGAAGVPLSCHTRETQDKIGELDAASYVAITIFSVIGFLMLLGTLVDVYQQFLPKDEIVGATTRAAVAKEPFAFTLLKCFSVNINGSKILSSQSDGIHHLGCLGGIRVISMLWIILGHTYLVASTWFLKNPMKMEEMYLGTSESNYEILLNSFPAVDTFFFMSGLLVAYISFIEMERKSFSLVLFYVHRYLRLTIPYALFIAFHVGITPHLGSGPFWSVVESSSSDCRTNWWANLLYVNNLTHEGCLDVSWFLACDMQFFVFSPVILYPLFKWRRIGIDLWCFVLFVATVVPISYVFAYDLPPSQLFTNLLVHEPFFDMARDFYMMPWCRAQPYLMGIMMGYILYRTKDKEIKFHWVLNVSLWVLSLAVGLAVVFGLSHLRSTNKVSQPSYTAVDSVLYNAFSNVGWSLGLGWVVFACVKGMGGLVNSFLSWGLFLPLARMTYMTFLIHYEFILMFFFSMTYTVELTDIIASYYYMGFFMISYGIAFVATLTVEAPFIQLERVLLGSLLRKKTNVTSGAKFKTVDKGEKAKEQEIEPAKEQEFVQDINGDLPMQTSVDEDYAQLARSQSKVGADVPVSTL